MDMFWPKLPQALFFFLRMTDNKTNLSPSRSDKVIDHEKYTNIKVHVILIAFV